MTSSVDDGKDHEDVFAINDLVYAMQRWRRVVQVYRNRSNSLINLHDIKYPCECRSRNFFFHSILVTDQRIMQCCAEDNLVSILDRSGELLRMIPIADIFGHCVLLQVDVEGNLLTADQWTNSLMIANVDQPSSQWRVVDLPNSPGSRCCEGAIWFRHKLYVTDVDGRFFTLVPVE